VELQAALAELEAAGLVVKGRRPDGEIVWRTVAPS